MNKDELKYLIEDLHKNELSKTGKIKLEIYIIDLQHQLQAYKDKEDKIRKYCNDKSQYWGNDSYINGKNEENEEVKNDVLQILNEEVK